MCVFHSELSCDGAGEHEPCCFCPVIFLNWFCDISDEIPSKMDVSMPLLDLCNDPSPAESLYIFHILSTLRCGVQTVHWKRQKRTLAKHPVFIVVSRGQWSTWKLFSGTYRDPERTVWQWERLQVPYPVTTKPCCNDMTLSRFQLMDNILYIFFTPQAQRD